ncbi:MAG: hypothetical protein GC154_12575 [bacterium]|nr:hypothetical protein [bacterium]
MTVYGKYDPQNAGNSSSLFVYKEVPVTSAKLNRWNANLEAGFELLHAVCSALFTRGQAAVIATSGGDALKVSALHEPALCVRVAPGWAVLDGGFAGLAEETVLPAAGEIAPPVIQPRIDSIVLLVSGDPAVIAGAESPAPAAPDVPEGALELARAYHRAGSTQVLNDDDGVNSYLIDVRPKMVMGDAHRHAEDLVPVESTDGARTMFSTAHVYRDGSLHVHLNGVRQQAGVDYAEDAGRRSYTFFSPPPAQSRLQHDYLIEYEIAE